VGDRKVASREATHARVEYESGGGREERTVTLAEAKALIERAEQAQRTVQEAAAAQAAAVQAERDHVKQVLAGLSCQVCGGRDFDEQTAREDSQWGMTTMRLRMLICRRCGFVMQFALGTSWFVPGG
jgi:hypothetical protein